jgi:hypothetical protein
MAKPFKPSPNQQQPAAARSTEVRNSPVPRQTTAAGQPPRQAAPPMTSSTRRQPSRDEIARKAYEIWQSGKGGSDYDNWIRAERELRGS